MPTIQFRTDDQTKAASTALFNQLGITMSEAINLFLRQTILRGGLPFPVTLPQGNAASGKIANDPEHEAILDALHRYQAVNNADFGTAQTVLALAEPFLQAIHAVGSQALRRITLYPDAVKVRLTYRGQYFTLDYNFEEPDSVFILTRKDGKLFVKDGDLAGIAKTLERF